MQIQPEAQIPQIIGEYFAGKIIQGLHITDYLPGSYSLSISDVTGYSKIQDTWRKTFVLSVPSKVHHLGSCSKNQQINRHPHPHLDHNL